MYIKSFVTIFSALFYVGVLQSKIVTAKDAPIPMQMTIKVLVWAIQAIIGANIVVLLCHIWS